MYYSFDAVHINVENWFLSRTVKYRRDRSQDFVTTEQEIVQHFDKNFISLAELTNKIK